MNSLVIYSTLLLFWHVSAFNSHSEWWKSTEIYDIYVPSFLDTNNDGIGDINGLISKLPYLKDLGIQTIKLSTIFKTFGMNTFYLEGVVDYKQINPLFGTMNEFENFMKKAEVKGIKVVIDFPINHCHQSHEWFQKSRRSIKPYKDYFIWRRGNTSVVPPEPPNFWYDENYDYVWTWDTTRKKFHYHSFSRLLPDLNLKNKRVKEEIKDIMNFWLGKGVAGFNLLAAYAYMKPGFKTIQKGDDENYYDTYAYHSDGLRYDQPETFRFLKSLRKIVDDFSKMNSHFERIIMVEDRFEENRTLKYFGDERSPLVHIVSNREFTKVSQDDEFITVDNLNTLLNSTIRQLQQDKFFEWVSEYSMTERLAQRFTKQWSELIFTIIATLPGIMRIHYGQEIGMSEPHWRDRDQSSLASPHILPMQWDHSINAGFTSKNDPFMIPNLDYWNVNVELQRKTNPSPYHMVRNLLKLRKEETLKYGDFQSRAISKNVYAFTRTYVPHKTYLTIINLSNEPQIITELHSVFENVPKTLRVVAATTNSAQQKWYKLSASSPLLLRPLSGIVVAFTNEKKTSALL